MYEERIYRSLVKTDDLVTFEVVVKETDLLVRAQTDLSGETRDAVLKYRHQLESYIAQNPSFATSLVPLNEDPYAPKIVREMIRSSRRAGVGPMAAIAGAVAEFVSGDLLPFSAELIVENGGDIYLASSRERTVAIYAGHSPLSMRMGVLVRPEDTPLGICTSSGTVGPSLSFGKADAVCILSRSAALADAAATAVGNRVKTAADIESGLDTGKGIEGVTGTVIILGDRMGAWGNVTLVHL
jgi:uncharacterized protein